MTSPTSKRQTALQIWQAGVDAVRAESLVQHNVSVTATELRLADLTYDLSNVGRICVVGAGKAAGYLAQAVEQELAPFARQFRLDGWINVPANTLVPTRHITLHAARPAGVNEPRPEGVQGTQRILELVSSLAPTDLCICLLTGGASALLPAPINGITLDDKLCVTRLLSENGADIRELNRVRIALSSIKGGGLARACTARQLATLIISDVIGDPLDLIGSGPTVAAEIHRAAALDILRRYAGPGTVPAAITDLLNSEPSPAKAVTCDVQNRILANNQTAVAAAATAASALGFEPVVVPAESPTSTAEDVAKELISYAGTPGEQRCVIWGGEPVVQLAAEAIRGCGGRNQQLVLSALSHARKSGLLRNDICILSGGTDGEDGPTDAAGAFADPLVSATASEAGLDADDHLARNDAYTFFQAAGGLLITGPTHTNVCDLRVLVQ